jgi:transketolase
VLTATAAPLRIASRQMLRNGGSPVPFGARRSRWICIGQDTPAPLSEQEVEAFELLDSIYRSLCAMMYNYVPTSGHPGGSISSGRFVSALLFDAMDYDFSDPLSERADIISYAAGHKALGLYSMWALRNEIVRIGDASLLPSDVALQLRLEDLLGFRRNPAGPAPLARSFESKPLDGHPTPATPFVRLATGASGVGLASSIGLAFAAADCYPDDPPRVHIVEGEGGLTPGRVAEALAAAGTASLGNVVVHLDWNQSSIDSDCVTREGVTPGDYVQWTPGELFYLNDWNVVSVPDGTSFQQIVAAQRAALGIDNGQPTAIIYRTTKGWRYGIEGRASHGAGHKLCAAGFYEAMSPLFPESPAGLPACDPANPRCGAGARAEIVEGCYWQALSAIGKALAENRQLVARMVERIAAARERLDDRDRRLAKSSPDILRVFSLAQSDAPPPSLELAPGTATTLRGQLGKVLGCLSRESQGALFISAADLLGSTSLNEAAAGLAPGYFNARTNPASRTLALGGICEDAMAGILSGVSTFGHHIGVGSSYAAFIAPLGHIAARLHAIGNQARQAIDPGPYRPFILVCAHAGLKTGEDGPTHADPQPLQLLQENFPTGAMITLTPWDPQEIWPLMAAALRSSPAVIAPFVSRPSELVPDRKALGLAPASDAVQGVYKLLSANGRSEGSIVLQESGVAFAFVEQTLPLLAAKGINLDVYYVASAELFDLRSPLEREEIFPEHVAMEAMGLTGFTLPTMYRWIRSDLGRSLTLHPFHHGRYPGSGPGERVIAEAGLDGDGQLAAILRYVTQRATLPPADRRG